MAFRKPAIDYYEVLGLSRDATTAEIAAAYRARIVQVRDIPGAGGETRRLNLAYRALSDPDRRRDYDDALTYGTADATLTSSSVHHEDQAEPSGRQVSPRRDSRPFLWTTVAAGLLLIGTAWVGSSLLEEGDNPPTAAASGGKAGEARQAARDERTGGLFAVLNQLTPGRRTDEAPPSEVAATTAAGGAEEATPDAAASSGPPAAPEDAGANVAEREDSQADPPAPSPSTGNPAAAPSPPPPPAPDRSAGARHISGGLADADNRGGRFQGTVGVRLTIGTNGRPQGCRVVRSSGDGALDSTTCRLLVDRLVFTPARDRNGDAVPTEVESTHVWGRRSGS